MTAQRFGEITGAYQRLRIGVVGDFCLDRYFEIDPSLAETSLETGLPVHNVVNVRSQPGAAGTVLNNLVALGVGTILPVGFAGEDGEGYELLRELRRPAGVRLDHFVQTPLRRTFTYGKPLVMEQGAPPRELNRLDIKNRTPTPPAVEASLCAAIDAAAGEADALLVMDQVDLPGTGAITAAVLARLGEWAERRPGLLILADSRRGLRGYPRVDLKMNAMELGLMLGAAPAREIEAVRQAAGALAQRNGRRVFITLAERGIVGAAPDGSTYHCPTLPVRGPIDIVGAGDAVSANLAAALAAGASVPEALELAMAAASIVIHQLGTTGTATVEQIGAVLAGGREPSPRPSPRVLGEGERLT